MVGRIPEPFQIAAQPSDLPEFFSYMPLLVSVDHASGEHFAKLSSCDQPEN
jgi:hypothetical protein